MKTRKKRGGWGNQQEKTVKRRHNLLAYTSNSKKKSNKARSALQQYLNHSHEEEKQVMITPTMALKAITPDMVPVTLTDYITKIHVKCIALIEGLIKENMEHKNKLNEKRRLFKKEIFLANRSATRAQQAAYIASLGRLSTSNDRAVQAELAKWNKEPFKRGLEQEQNEKEAARIFENTSSIEREKTRLRYVLTKQLAKYIIDNNLILQKYFEIRAQTQHILTNNEKKQAIAEYNKVDEKLKFFNKDDYRAFLSITEYIMTLLVNASGEYLKTVKGTDLEVAMAQLEHKRHILKQLDIIQIHYDILTTNDNKLGPTLAKNPLFEKSKYTNAMKNVTNALQKVEMLKATKK